VVGGAVTGGAEKKKRKEKKRGFFRTEFWQKVPCGLRIFFNKGVAHSPFRVGGAICRRVKNQARWGFEQI
jgi:hypothetical protein